jgi:hypothetical protein
MTPQVSSPSKSETLHFGYGDTSPGIIAVAESAHGVVALFIGNNRAKLLHDLQSAFPEKPKSSSIKQAWLRQSPRPRLSLRSRTLEPT